MIPCRQRWRRRCGAWTSRPTSFSRTLISRGVCRRSIRSSSMVKTIPQGGPLHWGQAKWPPVPNLPHERPLWVDAVDKRFSRGERATLSQDRSLARNIDSKNSALGFDCCPRAARRRLYRQHRSVADVTAPSRVGPLRAASSVALALKREARIPRISLNRSVIRMRAYAVRLLRLRRIEFSVHTADAISTISLFAVERIWPPCRLPYG